MRKGVLSLWFGLLLNAAFQVWNYRLFQATFHQGDGTPAAWMAGLWAQFSWVKLAASGLLFHVLGELYQQKADQKALVREIEADRRARGLPPSPPLAGKKRGWVGTIFDMFNF